jgi:hypothetical protein
VRDTCITLPKPHCFAGIASFAAVDLPGTGFSFDHWSGCTSTTGRTCAVVGDGARSVTAVFADTQWPSIALTAPGAGAHGGSIALRADASDNVGVQRVVFSAGRDVVGTDLSAPFSATFDTHRVADGPLSVQATAYDAAGHTTSRSRTITVDNTPPSLSVTGPDGQTFGPGSTQRWAITAADASGLASVRCRVTPNAFGACTTSHSVSGLPLGAHTFEVLATDKAGNTRGISRRFTIAAPPPQPAPHPAPTAPAIPATPAAPSAKLPAPPPIAAVPAPHGAPTVRRIFVTLAFRYRSNRRTTRLTRLVVKHVPKGATVKARCKRGCARRTYTRRHAHGTVSLKKLVRGKRLKAGTRITVTVSKRGMQPLTKQLRIRRRKSPSLRTLTSPRTRAPRAGA